MEQGIKYAFLKPGISKARKDRSGNIHVMTGSTDPDWAISEYKNELSSIGINKVVVTTNPKFLEVEVKMAPKDAPKFEKLWKELGGEALGTTYVGTAKESNGGEKSRG